MRDGDKKTLTHQHYDWVLSNVSASTATLLCCPVFDLSQCFYAGRRCWGVDCQLVRRGAFPPCLNRVLKRLNFFFVILLVCFFSFTCVFLFLLVHIHAFLFSHTKKVPLQKTSKATPSSVCQKVWKCFFTYRPPFFSFESSLPVCCIRNPPFFCRKRLFFVKQTGLQLIAHFFKRCATKIPLFPVVDILKMILDTRHSGPSQHKTS